MGLSLRITDWGCCDGLCIDMSSPPGTFELLFALSIILVIILEQYDLTASPAASAG